MDENKQLTSQEVHQAGGLLAMRGAASNNLNELQRMILGVRKGKAYIPEAAGQKEDNGYASAGDPSIRR